MHLADFILAEMEPILAEWEAFARSLYPAKARMTPEGLRDHARDILEAIAADLRTHQTMEDRTLKSRGLLAVPEDDPETAAQTHAVLRARSGLDINQLASEYRALRASVLRLWNEDRELDGHSLRDVIRFNEAIDQALAESVGHFSEQITRSRNLLLGTLGHDMRSPLNAIVLTAEHLAELDAGREVSEAAHRLIQSGGSMKSLLDDLVDFSRRNLGLGISIETEAGNLGELCAREVGQHRAAHPGCRVELVLSGDLQGRWDGLRLQQVLRNLLSNASQYGTAEEPVRVAVSGGEREVSIEVRNAGVPIEAADIHLIFEPLRRGLAVGAQTNSKGLGLGLYIVREITRAHGGEVELQSEKGETVFLIRLPRVSGETGGGRD